MKGQSQPHLKKKRKKVILKAASEFASQAQTG